MKINLSNTSLQLPQEPPTMAHCVAEWPVCGDAFCNITIIFVGYTVKVPVF